ncbi:MAG: hypothetical protein P8Y60_17140 [Calditrichota bacterium]
MKTQIERFISIHRSIDKENVSFHLPENGIGTFSTNSVKTNIFQVGVIPK